MCRSHASVLGFTGEVMTRTEQLDRMTEEDKQADLLDNLERCDFIRLERRDQLAFWSMAIETLVAKGLVTSEFIEVEEQYSYIKVRKVRS